MQARDVMTRQVVTVGPDTSAKYAAAVMAERGFAALPVLDDGRLVGIVAEADVLRNRIPPDPRLHARRDPAQPDVAVDLLVRGLMTTNARSVEITADVADIGRMFVDDLLRSVPVLEAGQLVGIVSRRDLLHALARPDADIRFDLLRLIEGYTGELGSWAVEVEGVATVQRTRGAAEPSPEAAERALTELAHTVGGVVAVHVVPAPRADAATPDPHEPVR